MLFDLKPVPKAVITVKSLNGTIEDHIESLLWEANHTNPFDPLTTHFIREYDGYNGLPTRIRVNYRTLTIGTILPHPRSVYADLFLYLEEPLVEFRRANGQLSYIHNLVKALGTPMRFGLLEAIRMREPRPLTEQELGTLLQINYWNCTLPSQKLNQNLR